MPTVLSPQKNRVLLYENSDEESSSDAASDLESESEHSDEESSSDAASDLESESEHSDEESSNDAASDFGSESEHCDEESSSDAASDFGSESEHSDEESSSDAASDFGSESEHSDEESSSDAASDFGSESEHSDEESSNDAASDFGSESEHCDEESSSDAASDFGSESEHSDEESSSDAASDFGSESEHSEEKENSHEQINKIRNEPIYQVMYASRQKAAALFRRDKPKSGLRHKSGQIPFQAIDIDEHGVVSQPRLVKKPSGYDENFKCETFGELKSLDKNFSLEGQSENFQLAFYHSRFPTPSYIHFKKTKDSESRTTGHAGGFFKPLSKNDASMPDIRSKSMSHMKKLKSTEGANTAGSVGKNPGFFHGERQAVIDKVIAEAKSSSMDVKKQSPVKATVEALKYCVTHTVGYRDNILENNQKFSGITTDGLNLADPVSRQYALKHYQAFRDAVKLGILKHEGRLSDVDSRASSDAEEEHSTPEKIERLNRKLAETVLEEKYHGPKGRNREKRNLSPLRCESPYSRANIETSLAMLQDAKTYEQISSVYNAPIPVLHPTSELFAEEDENRARAEPEDQIRSRI